MVNYQQELGDSLESFTVKVLQSIFAHVYYIWRVLKPELGYEKALVTYGSVWKAIALAQFNEAIESLDIKQIEDIPTLGKIVNHCFSANPCLYETVEESENYHVGHIHWCPNPAYGPIDCTLNRHEYYRNAEVPLTIDPYLSVMIEEARKMGLKDDIEIAVPEGRCRDGNASFCQIHLWKRGTPNPKYIALSLSEKKFIEDEMKGVEPISFILQKQGKKLEDFGPNTLIGFIFTDMAAHDGFEKELGESRAFELYKRLWLTFPKLWVREAKLDLGFGKSLNLKELGQLLSFCERKRFVPYNISYINNGKATLISNNDPFAEISITFLGKKIGDNYLKSVATINQLFLNEILNELNLIDKAKITINKLLVKGDDKNQISIEY